MYQIGESNGIEKIDLVARIESNRIETFLPELECSNVHGTKIKKMMKLIICHYLLLSRLCNASNLSLFFV